MYESPRTSTPHDRRCTPSPDSRLRDAEDGGRWSVNGGDTASYISPNARLSSFERLEIYNRQYWFRLISVVSEDFPTLNAVIGAKRFDALILAYLHRNPSTSWSLRDLGARLPEFLEAHPELGGRRHRLAVDVAKLEWAYVGAFDSKQLEPLVPEEALTVEPESQLLLQPHLQLLELAYPVDNLVLAVKKGMPGTDIVSGAARQHASRNRVKLPPMRQERIYLAVHRFNDSVYYRRIDRESFALLSALRAGASVAEAVTRAFEKSKLTPEGQTGRLPGFRSTTPSFTAFCSPGYGWTTTVRTAFFIAVRKIL